MSNFIYIIFGLYGGIVLSSLFNINQINNNFDKIIIFILLELVSMFFSYLFRKYSNKETKNKKRFYLVFRAILLSLAIIILISNKLIDGIMYFIYFLFLIYSILNLINYYNNENKFNILYNELIYLLVLISGNYFDLLTTLVGAFLIFMVSTKYNDIKNNANIKKYYKKSNTILITIITFLIAFMFYGNQLILNNNICLGVIVLILFSRIVYQFIILVLYLLETKIKLENKKKNKIKDIEKKEKYFSNITIAITSILISLIGCLILDDYLIKQYKDTTIYVEATGDSGKIDDGNEVYLSRIQTSNGDYDFKKVKTSDNWDVLEDSNSLVYHYADEKSTQEIKIKKARMVRMYFVMSEINGVVIIHDGDKTIKQDLSSDDDYYINNYFVYDVKSNVKKQNIVILSLKYILTFSVLFIISGYILKLLYKNRLKYSSVTELYLRRKSYLTIFSIVFLLMMLSLIAYYPGNLSWDNLYQYQQALGMSPVDSGHPIIMTLSMKLILKISESMFLISTCLMLLISLVVTTILNYLYHKGLSKKIVFIIAILFCLMPNTIMMSTNFLKDVPQAFLILLLCYFTYLIYNDHKEFSNNIYYLILLPVVIAIAGLLRHEMMYICYIIILAIAIFAFIKKNKKILLFVILSIPLIFGFEYVTNKRYSLENSSSLGGAYIFPAKGLASILADNQKLLAESEEYLINGMSLKKWKKNYSAYNVDSLSFSSDLNSKIQEKGLVVPVKCYLKEFFLHPYVILKDRLNSMDIMWNIHTNRDYNSFKYYDGVMTFYMMGPKEFDLKATKGAWKNESLLSNIYRRYIDISQKYEIFNMIFWRSGIYLALLFIVIIYLINNKKIQLLTLIPVIGKTLLWCILLSCQHYRYVYYLFLVVIFIIILLLVEESRDVKKI